MNPLRFFWLMSIVGIFSRDAGDRRLYDLAAGEAAVLARCFDRRFLHRLFASYGLDIKSGVMVLASSGTETCSCTITQSPCCLR